jgi:acetyl esterase/lipase
MKLTLRHLLVRLVWKIIDTINDRVAAKAELPDGVQRVEDLAYKEDGLQSSLLDVYYPASRPEPLPVLVYIHGGGLVAGDKRHYQQYGMTLAKAGYTVFNLNYRLSPGVKHPAQLADVLTALRWIQEHAARYGGDSQRLVLAGESAGAYLAAMTACLCTNERLAERIGLLPSVPGHHIKGTVLLCGLFDLQTAAGRKFPGIKSNMEMALHTKKIGDDPRVAMYSATPNITDNYPSVFISSGEVDGIHPESMEFILALESQNIPYTALLFDKREKKAYHAYPANLSLHTAKKCLEQVIAFLGSVTNVNGKELTPDAN